jgi:hypothetical protein
LLHETERSVVNHKAAFFMKMQESCHDYISGERGETCSTQRNDEKCSNVLVAEPEEKRPRARHRRRWEDNIKTDLKGKGCKALDWIDVAQDWEQWRAFMNMVMNKNAGQK